MPYGTKTLMVILQIKTVFKLALSIKYKPCQSFFKRRDFFFFWGGGGWGGGQKKCKQVKAVLPTRATTFCRNKRFHQQDPQNFQVIHDYGDFTTYDCISNKLYPFHFFGSFTYLWLEI